MRGWRGRRRRPSRLFGVRHNPAKIVVLLGCYSRRRNKSRFHVASPVRPVSGLDEMGAAFSVLARCSTVVEVGGEHDAAKIGLARIVAVRGPDPIRGVVPSNVIGSNEVWGDESNE